MLMPVPGRGTTDRAVVADGEGDLSGVPARATCRATRISSAPSPGIDGLVRLHLHGGVRVDAVALHHERTLVQGRVAGVGEAHAAEHPHPVVHGVAADEHVRAGVRLEEVDPRLAFAEVHDEVVLCGRRQVHGGEGAAGGRVPEAVVDDGGVLPAADRDAVHVALRLDVVVEDAVVVAEPDPGRVAVEVDRRSGPVRCAARLVDVVVEDVDGAVHAAPDGAADAVEVAGRDRPAVPAEGGVDARVVGGRVPAEDEGVLVAGALVLRRVADDGEVVELRDREGDEDERRRGDPKSVSVMWSISKTPVPNDWIFAPLPE
jgi:hypothetical protein